MEQVDSAETLEIRGESPRRLLWADLPERWSERAQLHEIGFECASGDWIERTYAGVDAFEVVDSAQLPAETTHLTLHDTAGITACVPITALDGAIIAIGGSDGVGDELGEAFPRFVSPHVIGPRAIKQLAVIEPLALDGTTDPTEYESLPKRD